MKNNSTKKTILDILKKEFSIKKKKNKKTPKEQPVELYGSNTSIKDISFSDIKKNVSWTIRDDILDWRNSDFVIYIQNKFNEKIDSTWECDKVAMVLFFGKITDTLTEIVSFCDNIVIKDYIDFFIDNWAGYYVQEKGNFTLWYMNENAPMKDFFKRYDYNESFRKYFSATKKKDDNKEVTSKEIEHYYYAGGQSLILEYGLLLPLNWLIECKKYSLEQSVIYIVGAFGALHSNGNWREVIQKTESLNPYPGSFFVQNCDSIFEKLNLDIKLNLVFSERNWCKF